MNVRGSYAQTSSHQSNLFVSSVNEKVIKEGVLYKKGIFNRYNNKYHTTLDDVYLKCVKLGKTKNYTIDLSDAIQVQPDKKSKKQFKVKSSKKEISFRAETEQERDEWVKEILNVAAKFRGRDPTMSLKVVSPSVVKFGLNNNLTRSVSEANQEHNFAVLKDPRQSLKPKPGLSNLTMDQISDMLKSQDSHLNQAIEDSLNAYTQFVSDMERLSNDPEIKKHKDKLSSLKDAAKNYQKKQSSVFELVHKTNKSLYRIVEQIAEKEIEKDPVEFMKRESINLGNMDKTKFLSIRNGLIEPIEESDEEHESMQFSEVQVDEESKNKSPST